MVTSLNVLRIETDPIQHPGLWNLIGQRFRHVDGKWTRQDDTIWCGPDTLLACLEAASNLEDTAENLESLAEEMTTV